MQIDFTPLGAYRFFGMPMREVAAQTVALEQFGAPDVLGPLDDLTGRLYDAPDWATRFVMLDRFIRRRLAAGRAPSGAIAWAWRQLAVSGGQCRVAALAREIGWSCKHLAGRFAIEVGVGPKTAGRILRFARARRSIDAARGQIAWADLAIDWGYADQAHLIREFHAMAGVTPADYVRDIAGRFRTFQGDPQASARR